MKIGLEDEHTEFKKSLAEKERGYKALAAMLNKHCSGTVYFGVDDSGTVLGLEIGKDTLKTLSQEIESKIEPKVTPSIEILDSDDGKRYLRVHAEGTDRPYSKDGMFFIRAGEENKQIPTSDLRRLFQSYSDLLKLSESFNQNLTFSELMTDLTLNGLHIEDENRLTSHYQLRMPNGKYNIQAELVSDQNVIPLTVVIFSGKDRTALSYRTDFSGHNLLREVRSVENYVLSLNETSVDMSSPMRKDSKLFDPESFREAWFNAAVHNTWTSGIPPTVQIFDDRMEIISNGSTPYGQSEEDFFNGVSTPINESLMRIFIAAGICEHTGHGIPVITGKYGREVFSISEGCVKVTLPFSNVRGSVLLRKKSSDFTESETKILNLLGMEPEITLDRVSELTGIGYSNVKRIVGDLKRRGSLVRDGSRKSGRWVIQTDSDDTFS